MKAQTPQWGTVGVIGVYLRAEWLTPPQLETGPVGCFPGTCISSGCVSVGGGRDPTAPHPLTDRQGLLQAHRGRIRRTGSRPAPNHHRLRAPAAPSPGCPSPRWTAAPQTRAAKAEREKNKHDEINKKGMSRKNLTKTTHGTFFI